MKENEIITYCRKAFSKLINVLMLYLPLRIVWKWVGTAMCQSHRLRVRWNWLVLRQCLVHLTQFLKVVMFEGLTCRHSITVIVDEQFCNDFLRIRWNVRDQLRNSGALLMPEIEFHVWCNSLELGEQLGTWRSKDVMDLVHLIKLVIAGEKGKEC